MLITTFYLIASSERLVFVSCNITLDQVSIFISSKWSKGVTATPIFPQFLSHCLTVVTIWPKETHFSHTYPLYFCVMVVQWLLLSIGMLMNRMEQESNSSYEWTCKDGNLSGRKGLLYFLPFDTVLFLFNIMTK